MNGETFEFSFMVANLGFGFGGGGGAGGGGGESAIRELEGAKREYRRGRQAIIKDGGVVAGHDPRACSKGNR